MDGWRGAFVAFLLIMLCLMPTGAMAQDTRFGDDKIAVNLFVDREAETDGGRMLALHFKPRSEEWHGYWSNPGDAGQGMDLTLDLPEGWRAGEPLYPVPTRLEIAGLMNHIFEGDYTVLVPLTASASARPIDAAAIRGTVSYLACTDRICVPQDARLDAVVGGEFDQWRSSIAPMLDRTAQFEMTGRSLRLGIPVPRNLRLSDPHVFVARGSTGAEAVPAYAAEQVFRRAGDVLVAEIPLDQRRDQTAGAPVSAITGILSFGDGEGVRFAAVPGEVPLQGAKLVTAGNETPPFGWLLLAALVGGLLLNVMPCVFPILSLKAIALARTGGDEISARRDALAYTAGIVLACAALGGIILVLRAAGEQIGWAFQLQEPVVVVALFLLAALITANFLGLFEVPGMAVSGGKASTSGSFATGLLAAFVATPCTGPFMALALGAALVLDPLEGLAIFTVLGVGLALPFLLIAFVPAFRSRLPAPGAWMGRFRRWMAVPMGLTVIALAWLLWQIGGRDYFLFAIGLGLFGLIGVALAGIFQRRGKGGGGLILAVVVAVLGLGVALLPRPEVAASGNASILEPAPFSVEALAEARNGDRPVFVWFTADWCVTCKVNEQVAIEREATRDAFEKAGVITLRGDWTRRDVDIATFLSDQGAAGVPLYLWYAPGAEAEQLPQILTPDLLVERARRQGPAGRRE